MLLTKKGRIVHDITSKDNDYIRSTLIEKKEPEGNHYKDFFHMEQRATFKEASLCCKAQ